MSSDVTLARLVVQEYDLKLLEAIDRCIGKLERPIPPDQLLDTLEQLGHDYAALAASFGARAHYALYIIEREELWRLRQVERDGEKVPEFKSFSEYRQWYIVNILKKASESTYFNYKDLFDRLEAMKFSSAEILELVNRPSRTRTALSLMVFDEAKQFVGIESGQDGRVLQRMMEEVGMEQEEGQMVDVGQVAREFVKMAALADGEDTIAVVNRVAGGVYIKWSYLDDREGGGPRIVITSGQRGHGKMRHNTFMLRDGEKLHSEIGIWLKKYKARMFKRVDQYWSGKERE